MIMISVVLIVVNLCWFFNMKIHANTEVWIRTKVRKWVYKSITAVAYLFIARMLYFFVNLRYEHLENNIMLTIDVPLSFGVCLYYMNELFDKEVMADVIIEDSSIFDLYERGLTGNNNFTDIWYKKLTILWNLFLKNVLPPLKTSLVASVSVTIALYVFNFIVWLSVNDNPCSSVGGCAVVLSPTISIWQWIYDSLFSWVSLQAWATSMTSVLTFFKWFSWLFWIDYMYKVVLSGTSISYVLVFYRSFLVISTLLIFPALSFTSLKQLVIHPIEFVTIEFAIPSSRSFEKRSHESKSNNAMNLIRERKTKPRELMSTASNVTSDIILAYAMSLGLERYEKLIVFSTTQDSFEDDRQLSTPRWQEAFYVHQSIRREIYKAVIAKDIGPPVVPYVGGASVWMGISGQIDILTKSLAMQNFATIATADSKSWLYRRKKIFAQAWNHIATASLAHVSAVTLQLQLIVSHALENVLRHDGDAGINGMNKRYNEEVYQNRFRFANTVDDGNGPKPSSDDNRRNAAAFQALHVLGGHFSVKNIDRPFSIPLEVTALTRSCADLRNRTFLGMITNFVLRKPWLSVLWPLARLAVARYPFTDALPPFVIQTSIHAVRGIANALISSLKDDIFGLAQHHVIATMDILIRFKFALEEYELCMTKCFLVNVVNKTKRVSSLDTKNLESEVDVAIDGLIQSFRDILSRNDNPLMQDDIIAGELRSRLKKRSD